MILQYDYFLKSHLKETLCPGHNFPSNLLDIHMEILNKQKYISSGQKGVISVCLELSFGYMVTPII